MTTRGKKSLEGPKIKRLSLYPRREEPQELDTVTVGFSKRAVITKERPDLKAPKRLPYYKESPPRYEQPQTPLQETAPAQPTVDNITGVAIAIGIAFVIFFFVIIIVFSDDNGGGGSISGCPTVCEGYAITIAPQCSCPAGSRYYNTITGQKAQGYKQCVC